MLWVCSRHVSSGVIQRLAQFTPRTQGSPCLILSLLAVPSHSQVAAVTPASVLLLTQARKRAIFVQASAVLWQATTADCFQVKVAKMDNSPHYRSFFQIPTVLQNLLAFFHSQNLQVATFLYLDWVYTRCLWIISMFKAYSITLEVEPTNTSIF